MGQAGSARLAIRSRLRAERHERRADQAEAQAACCDKEADAAPTELRRKTWRQKARWWQHEAAQSRRLARLYLATGERHELRVVYDELKRGVSAPEFERLEKHVAELEAELDSPTHVTFHEETPPRPELDDECASLQHELDGL